MTGIAMTGACLFNPRTTGSAVGRTRFLRSGSECAVPCFGRFTIGRGEEA